MSFEKGLSKTILDQTISLTADELHYTTSNTARVNVRTAIEDLISRVTLLEQNQVTPEAVPKYIFWMVIPKSCGRLEETICSIGVRVGVWGWMLWKLTLPGRQTI